MATAATAAPTADYAKLGPCNLTNSGIVSIANAHGLGGIITHVLTLTSNAILGCD